MNVKKIVGFIIIDLSLLLGIVLILWGIADVGKASLYLYGSSVSYFESVVLLLRAIAFFIMGYFLIKYSYALAKKIESKNNIKNDEVISNNNMSKSLENVSKTYDTTDIEVLYKCDVFLYGGKPATLKIIRDSSNERIYLSFNRKSRLFDINKDSIYKLNCYEKDGLKIFDVLFSLNDNEFSNMRFYINSYGSNDLKEQLSTKLSCDISSDDFMSFLSIIRIDGYDSKKYREIKF